MDDVAELAVVAFEGEDDAVFEQFGDAADSFIEVLGDDIGLLEVVVRIIHDDGDALRDLIAERGADGGVGRFGPIGGEGGKVFAARTVIDVEVVGLDVVPVEVMVDHLVLAEVRGLRLCISG